MLDKIGIEYDLKNIGTYKTKKGIEKIKLQIRLAKRKNLFKLRKLIRIPCKRKDDMLTLMMGGFVRYKEPLVIKDQIIYICKERGYITSSDLRKEMNYKRVNTAITWIKFYLNQGVLKCVEESHYAKGALGMSPAKYVLN